MAKCTIIVSIENIVLNSHCRGHPKTSLCLVSTLTKNVTKETILSNNYESGLVQGTRLWNLLTIYFHLSLKLLRTLLVGSPYSGRSHEE